MPNIYNSFNEWKWVLLCYVGFNKWIPYIVDSEGCSCIKLHLLLSLTCNSIMNTCTAVCPQSIKHAAICLNHWEISVQVQLVSASLHIVSDWQSVCVFLDVCSHYNCNCLYCAISSSVCPYACACVCVCKCEAQIYFLAGWLLDRKRGRWYS